MQKEEYFACRELINEILQGKIKNEIDLNREKKTVSAKYHLSNLPGNSKILSQALPGEYDNVIEILQRKPVRTISGVAVIAVMTSPAPCPHGTCIPCPGGPDSDYQSPQSYMGHEPATMRAIQHEYDPYRQVTGRLEQLKLIGHPINKAELIIMGGSFTARNICYQEWFVKRCIEAMNDFGTNQDIIETHDTSNTGVYRYFEDVQTKNETATVRNVGMTFETRPDWVGTEDVDRMLYYGGTKVEIGVQSIYDDVLKKMKRGHEVSHTIEANRALRDSGFKVGFHMMPGLPGSSIDMDLEMFKKLFSNEKFMPDYLKIYPALVTPGTGLYDMWKSGEYQTLELDDAVELIAKVKALLPPWVRLQRVQRDIPAWQIEGGVTKSNLRQLAGERLVKQGGKCRCIRCREAGHKGLKGIEPENVRQVVESYRACGGDEHFISYEDIEQDVLIGFLRLRYPNTPHRPELESAALVRELHVYGSMVSVGQKAGEKQWQHKGYGEELLNEAEELAKGAGFSKLSIISGMGVRPYYRKLGFKLDGPYMSKLI
ncbi:MAG: tRNA uridine(34) 5-carboxymethylaminomethyl modification radical SAM/GNAT enzyme Elp3 [Methanosarcinales archaeon]|nr:tRNA uridine(34) 5-carboxymethylaminomethyl modification radical SAM/GNAT enzyme Elp3 [Methanosarcinales archaeon]